MDITNVRLEIIKDDITESDDECIVNAANESLSYGGGVCGAIFEAAGIEKLQEECRKIGRCNTGCSVATSGCDLKSKYIIHAVGPVYYYYSPEEACELLSKTYRSIFDLAEELKISSISIPAISTGYFGFPKNEACKIALQECLKYNFNYVKKVTLCCFSEETYNELIKEFNELWTE